MMQAGSGGEPGTSGGAVPGNPDSGGLAITTSDAGMAPATDANTDGGDLGSVNPGHGGTGGNGSGGVAGPGTGGRGSGGRAGSGGTGVGGTAAGGTGSGAGGATGAAGSNCIARIKANGYSYPGAPPCSLCRENNVSMTAKCRAMIDCLALKWPFTPDQRSDCLNENSSSASVDACVRALEARACM